jgi:hypothetical protein
MRQWQSVILFRATGVRGEGATPFWDCRRIHDGESVGALFYPVDGEGA